MPDRDGGDLDLIFRERQKRMPEGVGHLALSPARDPEILGRNKRKPYFVWQSAITCAALERPKISSCADDNFFLDKGHDQILIDSLDKSKFHS